MRCHRPLSMLIATAVMVCGLGSVTLADDASSSEATVESPATASAQVVVVSGDGEKSEQKFEFKLPAGEGQQAKTIIVRINQDGQLHVESDGKTLDTRNIKLDRIQVQGKPAGVAVIGLQAGDGQTQVVPLPQVKVEARAVQVQPDAEVTENRRARVIRVESKPDEAGQPRSIRALVVRPQASVAEQRVEIIRESDAPKDADQPLRLRIRNQGSPSDGKAEDHKTEAAGQSLQIRRVLRGDAEAKATIQKIEDGQFGIRKSDREQIEVLSEVHEGQDGKQQFRIEIQTDGQIDPAQLKELVEKVRAEHQAHQHGHKHADGEHKKVEEKEVRVRVLGHGDLGPEKLKAEDAGEKAAKEAQQKQIRIHLQTDGELSPEKLHALKEKMHAAHAGEKAAKDGEQKQIRVRLQTDGPSKTASGNTMILRKERPQDDLEARLDRIEKELAALRKLLEKK